MKNTMIIVLLVVLSCNFSSSMRSLTCRLPVKDYNTCWEKCHTKYGMTPAASPCVETCENCVCDKMRKAGDFDFNECFA